MKNMKSICCVIASALMCVSIASCGQKKSSTDKKNLTGWDDYTLFFVRVAPVADGNIDILCYRRANTIRGNMFKPGSSSIQYNVQIDCTNEKQAEISYNYRHSDGAGNTDNTSILRIVGII